MMYDKFIEDLKSQDDLIENVANDAKNYLKNIENRKVSPVFQEIELSDLPKDGVGAKNAINIFKEKYEPFMQANIGPRYFAYVIGGTTPAALAADWYTSLYDQDAFGYAGTVDRQIEKEAVNMLRELIKLPKDQYGAVVSGATMANMAGLSVSRQWAAGKSGYSASEDGIFGMPKVEIASGSAHGATYKAISMLGMGRKNIINIKCLSGREAVDIDALKEFLENRDQKTPLIYIANAGTANSGDIDDLPEILKLKKQYGFYLHIDGAFVGIAACSDKFDNYFKGWGEADSITVDTHKWLNTPYDGAVLFTRHKQFLYDVFNNGTKDTGEMPENASLHSFTPEGSRRLRALSVWMSLTAYGKKGYMDIVDRNIEESRYYGELVKESKYFRLLNEVRTNVCCFTLNKKGLTMTQLLSFLKTLQEEGITFSNACDYLGTPALRVCVSNYRTQTNDIKVAFESLESCAKRFIND